MSYGVLDKTDFRLNSTRTRKHVRWDGNYWHRRAELDPGSLQRGVLMALVEACVVQSNPSIRDRAECPFGDIPPVVGLACVSRQGALPAAAL